MNVYPPPSIMKLKLPRFQAVVGSCHSTGALYLTLCNNPRGIRFLREETILVMLPPGPHEPTLEQLNKVMILFVKNMKKLYNGMSGTYSFCLCKSKDHSGVHFRVFGQQELQISHSQLQTNVSDLPASRKISGLQGHTSKWFMCPNDTT
jgi:hypothetical protein